MAKTQEPTPFYIRTREGETFHVESLEEALEEFMGDSGYRLTFSDSNGKELVIRRIQEGSPVIGGMEYRSSLIYREKE